MRRADRLFRIVQRLRRGALVTAADLAAELEVSERTIYRDMGELMTSGLPVEGAAGVGYLLRGSLDLPPLTFTRAELEALEVGARLVRAWGGGALATAAAQALDKINAALPWLEAGDAGSLLFAAGALHPADAHRLEILRGAVNDRAVIELSYTDGANTPSQRTVHPLGLFFWGPVWTLTAWCTLREDFRNFRLDRMAAVRRTGETFTPMPGRSLDDFIAREVTGCENGLGKERAAAGMRGDEPGGRRT